MYSAGTRVRTRVSPKAIRCMHPGTLEYMPFYSKHTFLSLFYCGVSLQVRGDKVSKAMEEVERREKIARLNEMMERRAFHEKGFEKVGGRGGGEGGGGGDLLHHGIAVSCCLRSCFYSPFWGPGLATERRQATS